MMVQSSVPTRLHLIALELSPTGMLAVDGEGRILLVNEEVERLFAYPREELIGQPVERLIPDHFAELHQNHRTGFFVDAVSRPMGSGRPLHGRRRDGTVFPVEVGLNIVDTAEGTHVVASVVDISDRRRAEMRFQAAFEAAVHGLILVDETGVIRLANEAMADKFGYDDDELIDMRVSELIPERFRERHGSDLTKFMKSPADRRMGAGRVLFGLRKDGTEFPVEIGLRPSSIGQERLVLATIVDITTRKQLEAKLLSGQRAEAVGALANGIAHDFNNILQGILILADVCLMDDLSPETANSLELIIKNSERGRELVGRILAFSRNIELPKRNIKPVEEIREILALLRASMPPNITMRETLAEHCPEIVSDPSLLHQVIMNLTTNAIQAMEKGGTLSVSVTATSVREIEHGETLTPGLYVRLTVEDDGPGMPPEVQGRAFDPFFTTKGPGRGSGLGLAVVKGIVEAHEGRVLLRSSHLGTRIDILLPALVRADTKVPAEAGEAPRVMIVDDDTLIADALEHMLRRHGLHATTFPSPVEALAALDGPERWDLILTDNGMPVMSGLELASAIRASGHHMPIALITGHVSPDERELHLHEIGTVLRKPVRAAELLACLRELLGKQG